MSAGSAILVAVSSSTRSGSSLHITLAVDDDTGDEAPDEPDSADASDEETIELRFSATEVLRHKDFADYSEQELTEAQQLMTRLRLAGSPRESRTALRQQGAHGPTRPAPHGSGGDEVERRAVPAALA